MTKYEHFDWVILKPISLLANQNGEIWGSNLIDDSANFRAPNKPSF